ncbi:DUF2271 domain-containing protein [Solimonas flava]|uniref:DUF2271 domain-containing protein n=1 Tax=Solimonas flava TaxID=415849 RepID=UPI00040D4450|nr:DUF2271 domain-containing protein [Solimonas flava]
MRTSLSVLLCGAVSAPAAAAELDVTLQIPQLDVAEYHRPYVAVWIEGADQRVAANLAVWYDLKKKDGEGTKWLKDLRQWWRRSGRELQMPVDGVSGATRVVGEHTLHFSAGKAPLPELAPGQYQLMVEAAREVGGRELLKIPFQWPIAKAEQLSAQGSAELGRVTLALKP